MDWMVDQNDVRSFVGVTPGVSAVSIIVLGLSTCLVLWGLISITCCWKRTAYFANKRLVAAVAKKRAEEDEERATTTTTTAFEDGVGRGGLWFSLKDTFAAMGYYVTTRSPYYYWIMWASECYETLFQLLAIKQLSESGLGAKSLGICKTSKLIEEASPFPHRSCAPLIAFI